MKTCPSRIRLALFTAACLWISPPYHLQAQEEAPPTPTRDETTPARPRRPQEVLQVGSEYHLKKGEYARQVVVIFAPATIDGEVDHDVVVVGGHVTVNGKIGGSLVSPLGSAELGPEAKIDRDVITVGGELTASPTSEIGGQRHEIAFAKFLPKFQWLTAWLREGLLHGRPLVPSLGWSWGVAAIFTLVYLALALILPKPVHLCVQTLESKPIISFFSGLLALVAFGPLMVIMSVTVIGPLVLLAGYLAAGALGRVAVLSFFGQRLGRGMNLQFAQSPLGSLLVGAALISILYAIPVLGILLWLTLVPLALGSTCVATVLSLQSNAENRPRFVPAAVGALAAPAPTPAATAALVTPPLIQGPPALDTEPQPHQPTPTPSEATHAPLNPTPAFPSTGNFLPTPGIPALTPMDHLALPRAGFLIRFLATFLDFIPMAILIPVAGPLWIVLWTAYHVAMWAWRGSTLGGIVLGLKVIRIDGRDLDLPVALVRGLASYFSLVVLFLGFFWVGWTKDKQSWHDLISGTVMVKTPKGMPLI